VKTLLPVVAAGSAFAAAAVIGLLFGVLLASRRGEPLWAPVGLMLGAGVGAYSAFRVLIRSMR
jgi:integral membrane sensor domain MASE1